MLLTYKLLIPLHHRLSGIWKVT